LIVSREGVFGRLAIGLHPLFGDSSESAEIACAGSASSGVEKGPDLVNP